MDLDKLLSEVLTPLGVELENDSTPAEPVEYGYPTADSTCTMFQTSREHYGTFYRLDLINDIPHLLVIFPDEHVRVRMSGYLVIPSPESPLRGFFPKLSGSITDVHAARNHTLFACGEIMKNSFWAGNTERMDFSDEIIVMKQF